MKSFIIFWRLFATLFLILASHTSEAVVYKCKNTEGKLLYQKTPCKSDTKEVNAWTPKIDVPKTRDPLILKQNTNGHYFVKGEADSHQLTFVVDTGASMVTLPKSLLGNISCTHTVIINTANGRATGCEATIKQLKVGHFSFKDIKALVATNLDQPLLGMNVLENFDIQQKNGEMRLSERVK